MLNVIKISSTEKKENKFVDYRWDWKAGNPISPRVFAKPEILANKDYVLNPKPEIKKMGSPLYAALGKGNEANSVLQTFLGNIGGGMLLANTFYMEGNGRNPVIETPLSATASIMELLLQSWGGKVRVFHATPDDWEDASFDQLRAQGGFLVSASRSQGKTQWVTIKSLAGHPCIVKVQGWSSAVSSAKNKDIKAT